MSGPSPPEISEAEPIAARKFTLFQRRHHAHELVNGSMAVSRAMLHGSFPWSSHNGPEGRLVLKFPLGWQNVLCPIQRWYKAQQARSAGQRASTTFDTIEHHRSLDGPFFHEFLLIPISDGSGYRVERTGVGSDADAVSPMGCEANDLIEWFPVHKFQLLAQSEKSRLIARFKLDSELDILNVLAGCYSIYEEKQTRGYTLQRYNCYFFCCTILAVLVRRVADWEDLITEDLWPDLLKTALARLLRLSEHPLSDEARRHLLLRLFNGLDPRSQQPTQYLVDALQEVLGSEAAVRDKFNHAIATMIWGSDYQLSMDQYLGSYIRVAALKACTRNQVCDQVLNIKDRDPVDDARVVSSNEFKSLYASGDTAAVSALSAHVFQDLLPALEREHQISRGIRLFSSIRGVIGGLIWSVSGEEFPGPAKATEIILFKDFLFLIASPHPFCPENESLLTSFDIPGLHAMLNHLEKKGPLVVSEVALALEGNFMGFYEGRNTPGDRRIAQWAETVAGAPLYEMLVEEAAKILSLQGPSIQIIKQHDGHSKSSRMNMLEFQAHIESHIQHYANRVDRYQLSIARVVHRDVRDAISKVWKAMPEGFGPRSGSQGVQSYRNSSGSF